MTSWLTIYPFHILLSYLPTCQPSCTFAFIPNLFYIRLFVNLLVHFSVFQPTYAFACLLTLLYIHMFANLLVYLSVCHCLYIFLFANPLIHSSVCQPVCIFAYSINLPSEYIKTFSSSSLPASIQQNLFLL